MANDTHNMVKLAYVASPHGLKGEAEIRLVHPDAEEVLSENLTVWLFPASAKSAVNSQGEQWSLSKLRFGNKILCQFEGIKDRTQLERMLPFEVHLPRENFPTAEEDEFYLMDLIGLNVISPEGLKLGELVALSDNGMQELFDVRLLSGEIITLPYVDAFFPEIDLEAGTITMISPEYTE